jgi:LemA protein
VNPDATALGLPLAALSTGAWVTIAVAAVLTLFLVWLALTYNRLVTLRNRFLNAFSQIDVQLKRRYDLIPNLVEAVKGYMQHEQATLEAVIQARNAAVSANQAAVANPRDSGAVLALIAAENTLLGRLGTFLGLREAYPELKANQHVLRLMEELASAENRVAFARQSYNDSVTSYNTKRQTFPTNLFAGMMGFAEATLFEVNSDAERQVVQVSLQK